MSSDDDPPSNDRVANGVGWALVVIGALTTVAVAFTALAPPAPHQSRPMSEFGYGPDLGFPCWAYPLPFVLFAAALYFGVQRRQGRAPLPLVVALGLVAVALAALIGASDSILGPAHLEGYRSRCAGGSVAGCVALSRCAPERAERVRALRQWCAIDPAWGCSAQGSALVRSVDWPETPASEREERLTRGIAMLSDACERGAVNACRHLSGIYRTGRYVPPDLAAADRFWEIGEARARRGR